VLLLNAENGAWTHDSEHGKSYRLCWTWKAWAGGVLPNQTDCWGGLDHNGSDNFVKVHNDHGFCGVSDGYYKHIYENPRFKSDWKWQIEQCHSLYKGGTKFYGWDHREERGKNIIFNNPS